jgi:dephospho-CoA kinase
MKVIGLGGEAGCGKSAVGKQLADHDGIVWIDLDRLAWKTYRRGTNTYDRLISRFGRFILSPTGQIDRSKLSRLVFADRQSLDDLNAIVHPVLSEHLRQIIEREEGKQTCILLVEGALLGISKHIDYSLYDGIIWLFVSEKTRKQRLQAAGRVRHLQRRLSSPMQADVIKVNAEGTIEQTTNLVLQAISEVSESGRSL